MNRRNRWIEQLVKKITGKKIPLWIWPLLIAAMKLDDFCVWVWNLINGAY